MAIIRIGKSVVGIKPETVADHTYNEPAAAEAFPAFDIQFSPDGELFKNPEATGHYGKLAGVPGAGLGQISFKVIMRGMGSVADVPPHFNQALMAAGLSETITGATNVIYKPASSFDGNGTTGNPAISYSVCAWHDGIKYAIKGAAGNVVFTWTMGQGVEAAFTFSGAYVDNEDEAVPTPVTVSNEVAPTFLDAGFSVLGDEVCIESFSVDMNGVLARIVCANDANGVKGYAITDRTIQGTMNPNQELVADKDFLGEWRAGTVGALLHAALGAATNQITFNAPVVQYDTPGVGDREGIQILDIPFFINIAGAGAEGSDFSLTFS